MSDVTKPFTADQLLQMRDDGFRYELVRGELRKSLFADYTHGRTAANIAGALFQHVHREKPGSVCGPGTGFLLWSHPDTVRAPDISFVKQPRLDDLGLMEGYFPGAPDLAGEVNSIFDTCSEIEGKVFDWLEAGTRMVVVIDPCKRAVTVYRSLTEITVLTENEILYGWDVVPGWSMPVRNIFE